MLVKSTPGANFINVHQAIFSQFIFQAHSVERTAWKLGVTSSSSGGHKFVAVAEIHNFHAPMG